MPSRSISERVERLAVASVGITAAALAESDGNGPELTLPQWRVLVLLGNHGALRVTDLAGMLSTSLPSASRLVQRLERRELVATEHDDADRRAHLVTLSGTGQRALNAVITARRQRIANALRGRRTPMPDDLAAGLDAIIEALEGYA